MGNVSVWNMRYVSGGSAGGDSLLCIIQLVSIEDRTIVGLHVVETLQYWPHTLVSLRPRLFYYEKGQPRTGSREMVRVACTHPMETSGMTYGGAVLYSQVA